jgi:hypothetical protein
MMFSSSKVGVIVMVVSDYNDWQIFVLATVDPFFLDKYMHWWWWKR